MRPAPAVLALLLAAAPAQARSLYFVGDQATGRWCVFKDRGAMLAEEERLQDSAFSAGAVMMGEARLDAKGAITELDVTFGPPSGDWATTDTYRLERGRATEVRRTTGYANGDPQTFQTFARRGDAWAQQRAWGGPGYLSGVPPEAEVIMQPYYVAVTWAARAVIPQRLCKTIRPR